VERTWFLSQALSPQLTYRIASTSASGPGPSFATFQFFSHERSRILVHRVFGDERAEPALYAKSWFPCSLPRPAGHPSSISPSPCPSFSPDLLGSFAPHTLRHLAPIPATTSAYFRYVSLIDVLGNDQLRRILVHRPAGPFLLRWRARCRCHHSPSLAGRVNTAGWRAPSTGAALPPASVHSLRQPQNHSTGALVHIQSGFLVVSYSGSHEASSLRTLAFRWRARDPANRALRSKDAFSPYAEPGYYSWQGRSFTRRSDVSAREPLPPARRRRREGPAVVR
jgi:hypothetical protein